METFNITRRVLLAACLALPLAAVADTFPSKPIRLINPAPPGGVTDASLRILATELSKVWGQQVIVDNRPGATGLISQQAVMASPPDGHVLGVQLSGFMIVLPVMHGERFSTLGSLTPVAMLSEYPLVLTTSSKSPFNNWKELAEHAASTGRPITYATSGIGGTPHLTGEQIKRATGVDLQDVPYKGDAPMLTDIAGGQVMTGLPIIGSALAMAKGGQVKFLGVTSGTRAPFAPDVPTLKEQGVNVASSAYTFFVGPPGMAPQLVERLNRDIDAVLRLPSIQAFYTTNALVHQDLSAEQLTARVKADTDTGQALIRDLKLQFN